MCCKAVSNRLSGVVYTWDDKCPEERGAGAPAPPGVPGSQFKVGGGKEVENKNRKSDKEEDEMSGTFVIEVETPPEQRINHKIDKADFDI